MKKKKQLFTRILISALWLLLAAIVIARYFFSGPEISGGIITILLLLTVVSLSEAFDNFSIGKLFSLSRFIKRQDDEIDNLRTQITTFITQKQTNITQVIARPADDYEISEKYKREEEISSILENEIINEVSKRSTAAPSPAPSPTVSKLNLPKTQTDNTVEDNAELNIKAANKESAQQRNSISSQMSRMELEELAIRKYANEHNLQDYPLIRQMKIENLYSNDPLDNYNVIFDAYIKTGNGEIFIEVKPIRTITGLYANAIIPMLNRLDQYRRNNGKDAYLTLLCTGSGKENDRRNSKLLEDLYYKFDEYIRRGVLKIEFINISKIQNESLRR